MNKILCALLLSLLCIISLSAQSIEEQAKTFQQDIENNPNDSAKAGSYIQLGMLYVYSDPNKALKLLHEALAFNKKIKYHDAIVSTLGIIFNTHDVLGSHTDSLMTYINAIKELYDEVGDHRYGVKYHWNMAIYHQKFEENDKVIESYLKALDLVRTHDVLRIEEARLLGSVGDALGLNGDPKGALKYYQQALPLFGKDKIGEAITYLNMGKIYNEELKQLDSASLLLDKAYDILNEYEHYTIVVEVLVEKGLIYDAQKQHELANQVYSKALELTKKYNFGENYLLIYDAFANHYYEQKKYSAAINYCNKAIELSLSQNDKRYLESLYKIQEKSYAGLNDFRNAYTSKTKLTAHLDSINNAERQGKFKELQTKYEVDQKELENQLLKSKAATDAKALQSRTAIAVALLLGLLLLGSWALLIYRSNQQKQKYNEELEHTVALRTNELKSANQELQQVNYELKTFNYIASHDIKEPIRNIGNYAGLIFRKLPDDLKQNFEYYFKTIKNSSNQLYTLVEDFSKYTQLSRDNSIDLQPVDLNMMMDSLIFGLDGWIEKQNGKVVNEGLPVIQSSSSLIYTILKNIIENGLKYNQSRVPTVTLSATENDTHQNIHIKDNGIGIQEEFHDKIFEMLKRLNPRSEYQGSGIGLAIVRLLTDKLNIKVTINSEVDKGTEFVLAVPKIV